MLCHLDKLDFTLDKKGTEKYLVLDKYYQHCREFRFKRGKKVGKHIFVLGGVLSSLGKGISSASIGFLLKHMGYSVAMQKLDPYLNVCIGEMSPFQHGEVFVTDDGGEGDLDLGHYERFTGISTSKRVNATSGVIYESVNKKERNGEYQGKTVQVIPHITDEIKSLLAAANAEVDFTITEIGGTVGDIESLPFIEAIRQYMIEKGFSQTMCIFLTYIPYVKAAGELKTKPTQYAVNKLRELGIQPNLLLCRTEMDLEEEITQKIALFTNVHQSHVKQAIDADSVYEIPKNYLKEGVHKIICKHFSMPIKEVDFAKWDSFLHNFKSAETEVNIAICGKYVDHKDAYISLVEALTHSAAANELRVNIHTIDSEADYSQAAFEALFKDIHAIILPRGGSESGIEGMIRIVHFARTQNIPFLSICYGMHVSLIEFARNVCKIAGANSQEIDPQCENPIIVPIPHSTKDFKRLGSFSCKTKADSLSAKIYLAEDVSERHRHSHCLNQKYIAAFEEKGMIVTATSVEGDIAEVVEIPAHPFYIGVQFIPEYISRPEHPHKLYNAFLNAAKEKRDKI
ncbi:MAG: CTP synthase [Candidatus Cloacimonetes bacterium]|nr:CTP synthase [Candidatus Cloacimonadota bacterium]